MKKFLGLIVLLILFENTVFANIVEELTSLNSLYKEGVITKEEFIKAKEILLKSNSVEKKNKKKIIKKNSNKKKN